MAKQKKNSNYVTEKTIAAKAQKEAEKLQEQKARTIKLAAIWTGGVIGVLAVIFLILLACGAFKYSPEVTSHATVTFDDGSSIHIGLYGHDAEETVKHFEELCKKGFFNGKEIHSLIDGLLYMGSENKDGGKDGIKGEFSSNGVENKVLMEKGVVCMSRGEGKDSAYGQFFILTEDNKDLMGEYAAFGKLTDVSALETLLDKITFDENGNVTRAPKITSITTHTEDDHAH